MQSSVAKNLVPGVAAAVVQAGLPLSEVESFIGMRVALSFGYCQGLTCIEVALTSGSLGDFGVSVTPAIVAAGIDAMQTVFSNAFRQIYLVSIAFGCMALLFSVSFSVRADKASLITVLGISCFAVVFIRDIDHKLTM